MQRKLAAFDIDGTMTHASLGIEFLKEMANLEAIKDVPHELFKKQYSEWLAEVDRTAYYDRYLDGYYDSNLSGVGKKVFDEAGRKVAEHNFGQFYTIILDKLKHHKENGYFVLIVSKSPKQAVKHVASLVGADDYWGWQFNFDANNKYIDQFVYPNEESDKANIIRTMAAKHNLTLTESYAYGDSSGDISMLQLVTYPIAVNPEPELLAVALENNWQIIRAT